MGHIKEFAVEKWMDEHETWATHNLAETCCASVSLDDLLVFAGNKDRASLIDFSQKQTYGAIRGSDALRSNIANLYRDQESEPVSKDNILITNGAIQANFLALYTNIARGDHVICQYPTYQQLYSVPESFGAEVSLWRADEQNGWQVNLDDLRSLIRPNTKVIIINNPQNPTGAVLSRDVLQEIVDIARQHGIIIHSDEVYRPLFHSLQDGQEEPPSILSFNYEKTVATSSMSKAFSLAGIRLGWIASRSRKIIEQCATARDYTLISVSQIDDRIAVCAISEPTVSNILKRNLDLARGNLDLLDGFIKEFSWAARWVRPHAGTTAFIKFLNKDNLAIDDVEFCKRLQADCGVMFVPGSRCFGEDTNFKGYVRIGYVCERQVLIDGLKAMRKFMADAYHSLPVAV
ncbi:tyrosine aminotransferase [Aspergillus udagawae]|uniref:Tyrosine aminotransferase n=1 Tax=Aspergillus udagawae TaxID=91492 RepID=A0ABQ1AHS1_9EURO|nr:tyrosine aminotransferase [Aspergillus udagawae]GFF82143.1 tyrosine aminotransferase [Aspergillus udagawae]